MNNKYLSQIMSNKYLTYAFVIVVGLCLKSCGSMIFNRSSSPEVKPEVIEEAKEEKEEKREERKAGSYQTVEYAGMSFEIPDYYGENESDSEDSIYYFAETGSKFVYLYISSIDASEVNEDFSKYHKEIAQEFINEFIGDPEWQDYKESDSKLYDTKGGLQASETSYFIRYKTDERNVPMDGVLTILYNKENNKLIVASLLQSQEADYEYRETFRKMIDKAKPADGSSASTETQSTDTSTPSPTDSSEIRPEFKQTMDNYEAWFDHYCEVMTAYKENPSDINLLTEMTSLLSEEVTMLDQLEKMDQSEMNAAELAYYIEVTGRIQQKLIAVGS